MSHRITGRVQGEKTCIWGVCVCVCVCVCVSVCVCVCVCVCVPTIVSSSFASKTVNMRTQLTLFKTIDMNPSLVINAKK